MPGGDTGPGPAAPGPTLPAGSPRPGEGALEPPLWAARSHSRDRRPRGKGGWGCFSEARGRHAGTEGTEEIRAARPAGAARVPTRNLAQTAAGSDKTQPPGGLQVPPHSPAAHGAGSEEDPVTHCPPAPARTEVVAVPPQTAFAVVGTLPHILSGGPSRLPPRWLLRILGVREVELSAAQPGPLTRRT